MDILELKTGQKLNDEQSFFTKVVNVFSNIYIDDINNHLTTREVEFLYCAFRAIRDGRRDILSKDVVSKYFTSFGGKKQRVQVYLAPIVRKLWLFENAGEYFISGKIEELIKTKEVNFQFLLKFN